MSGMTKTRKKRVRRNVRKKPSKAGKRIRFVLKSLAGAFFLVTASSVFIFGYDYFTQTDHFNARKVTVEGEHRLTEKQVRHQAQIHPGDNILSVNLSVTRKRLVAHPWIQWASVERQVPGEIHIKIKEHLPLAVLAVGEKQYVIDLDGRIFKEKGAKDEKGLPLVTGLDFIDISIDGVFHPKPFQAALSVLEMGNRKNSVIPTTAIQAIEVDRETGVTIRQHHKPWAVKLGFGNYTQKYEKLKKILPGLKKTGRLAQLKAIDLNDIHRIVVTPAV